MDTRLSTTVISHEGYCGLYRCTCDTHGFRLLAPKVMYTHSIYTYTHTCAESARERRTASAILLRFSILPLSKEREREREREGEEERGNSFSMCRLCDRVNYLARLFHLSPSRGTIFPYILVANILMLRIMHCTYDKCCWRSKSNSEILVLDLPLSLYLSATVSRQSCEAGNWKDDLWGLKYCYLIRYLLYII
jgi:hypothetical protein